MRAFVDTSALIKKYITEKGSEEFDRLLEEFSEIVIAPIYWIEVNAAIERRLQDGSLAKEQGLHIRSEAAKDMLFFRRIIWNEDLEARACKFVIQYHLRTLDSIQLSAATLSKSDHFICSDKVLTVCAKKEIKNVHWIG